MRKVMLGLLMVVVIYFVVGGLIFNHLFPPKQPSYGGYFSTHRILKSEVEGVKMTITKVENEQAYARLELVPGAVGPPEHLHETFDEYFMVKEGTLAVIVNGKKKSVRQGESIMIPKNTPHKVFNESDKRVIVYDSLDKKSMMTAEFAYGLAQFYPQMDKIGDPNSPKILLCLAAQGNMFDTWRSDVPLPAQKIIRWILGPSARLLGF